MLPIHIHSKPINHVQIFLCNPSELLQQLLPHIIIIRVVVIIRVHPLSYCLIIASSFVVGQLSYGSAKLDPLILENGKIRLIIDSSDFNWNSISPGIIRYIVAKVYYARYLHLCTPALPTDSPPFTSACSRGCKSNCPTDQQRTNEQTGERVN